MPIPGSSCTHAFAPCTRAHVLYLANVGMSMLRTRSMHTHSNAINPILFRAVSIRMAPSLQHAHPAAYALPGNYMTTHSRHPPASQHT